ncbi:MAG: ATP--guanido phosphotransferase [Planctomycetes bacterium]|nr:ATP--guanido phosphotransferase [Planctomycetota bacterium]
MPERLTWCDLDTIDDLERTVLVERHLISRELAGSKRARGVATDTEEAVAIMINEEDHLRVQVFASGLQTEAAWRRAERLDDALMRRLPYAWSEEFGFLTSCPTNTGTGLRLSVMVHLPGLVWAEEIEKATNTAQKIHLAVRGLYGEGSRALGDFYQVSNQVTLGRSESQIQGDVELAVSAAARHRPFADPRPHLPGPGHPRTGPDPQQRGGPGLPLGPAIRHPHRRLAGFTVAAVNRALLLSQPGHLQRHREPLSPTGSSAATCARSARPRPDRAPDPPGCGAGPDWRSPVDIANLAIGPGRPYPPARRPRHPQKSKKPARWTWNFN